MEYAVLMFGPLTAFYRGPTQKNVENVVLKSLDDLLTYFSESYSLMNSCKSVFELQQSSYPPFTGPTSNRCSISAFCKQYVYIQRPALLYKDL